MIILQISIKLMRNQAESIQRSFNAALFPTLKQHSINCSSSQNYNFNKIKGSNSLAQFQKDVNEVFLNRIERKYQKQNKTKASLLPPIQNKMISEQIQILKKRIKKIELQKTIDQKVFDRVQKLFIKQNQFTFQQNSQTFTNPFKNSLEILPTNFNQNTNTNTNINKNKFINISKNTTFKKKIKIKTVIIAVIFILRLPRFFSNFTMGRFNSFKQEFLDSHYLVIHDSNFKTNFLKDLKLIQSIIEVSMQMGFSLENYKQVFVQNKQVISNKGDEENQQQEQEESQTSSKIQSKLLININLITSIIRRLFENIKKMISQEKLQQIFNLMRCCCLSFSFCPDWFLHRKQAQYLVFSITKGYMFTNHFVQKALISNFFIAQFFVFNLINTFCMDPDWIKSEKRRLKLKTKFINNIKIILQELSLVLLIQNDQKFSLKSKKKGNYKLLNHLLQPKTNNVGTFLPEQMWNENYTEQTSKLTILLSMFSSSSYKNMSGVQYAGKKQSINYLGYQIKNFVEFIHQQTKKQNEKHYEIIKKISLTYNYLQENQNFNFQRTNLQNQSQSNETQNTNQDD